MQVKFAAVCLVVMANFFAVVSSPALAWQKCSKYKGAAYKRCLSYYSMAGTPEQRKYARKQKVKDRADRNCRYQDGEKVCTSSSH